MGRWGVGWGGGGGGRCDPAYVKTRKACHASRGLSRVSGPLWGFSSVQHDRSFSRAIVILPSISSRFSRQPPLRLRVSIYFLFVPPPPPSPPPSQSIHQAGDDPRVSPSRLLHIRSTPTASLSPSARPFFFFKPLPRTIICISLDRGDDACRCLRPCQSLFFFPVVFLPLRPPPFCFQLSSPSSKQNVPALRRSPGLFPPWHIHERSYQRRAASLCSSSNLAPEGVL